MKHEAPFSGFPGPEPTPDELARRKRISDRAELLAHIDHILRPPGWVYDEIEEAIRQGLAGNLNARIESREGRTYAAAELIEGWELEPMFEVYGRALDDPSYRRGGI